MVGGGWFAGVFWTPRRRNLNVKKKADLRLGSESLGERRYVERDRLSLFIDVDVIGRLRHDDDDDLVQIQT